MQTSGTFFTLTLMIALLIVLIFAMKYAVQLFKARADAARASATETSIAALTEKSVSMDRRVAHLEALLKEVE